MTKQIHIIIPLWHLAMFCAGVVLLLAEKKFARWAPYALLPVAIVPMYSLLFTTIPSLFSPLQYVKSPTLGFVAALLYLVILLSYLAGITYLLTRRETTI